MKVMITAVGYTQVVRAGQAGAMDCQMMDVPYIGGLENLSKKERRTRMIKDRPNKVTTALKIVITGEFYDDEASEETLRYCAEQALEDAGFDVDVSVIRDNRLPFSLNSNVQWT